MPLFFVVGCRAPFEVHGFFCFWRKNFIEKRVDNLHADVYNIIRTRKEANTIPSITESPKQASRRLKNER